MGSYAGCDCFTLKKIKSSMQDEAPASAARQRPGLAMHRLKDSNSNAVMESAPSNLDHIIKLQTHSNCEQSQS